MEHNYWEERIQGYIDNELEPADHTAVEKHVDACKDCATHIDYYRALKRRLKAHADSVEIPAAVASRLNNMMARKRRPVLRIWVPAGLALAATLVAVMLLFPFSSTNFEFEKLDLIGRVTCHDCEIADRAGLAAGVLCEEGHRLGLVTKEGKLWRVATDQKGLAYLKAFELYGKQVELTGKALSSERLFRLETYSVLVPEQAALQH